jgi:hypothetical protein
MASKKGRRLGASDKAQYVAYKSSLRFQKNKKAKLEAHCKKHPEDENAAKVLAKGTWSYSRNRKSNGHKCKAEELHNLLHKTATGLKPNSAGEQMVELDLVSEKQYEKYEKRINRRFG